MHEGGHRVVRTGEPQPSGGNQTPQVVILEHHNPMMMSASSPSSTVHTVILTWTRSLALLAATAFEEEALAHVISRAIMATSHRGHLIL